MSKPIKLFIFVILLFVHQTALSMDVNFSKTDVKWGEPVTVKITVTNPLDKVVQGGITVSFSGSLIVTDHDTEGKVYWEGNKFQYSTGLGHKCCIVNKEIVVENWYKNWGANEEKTMTITFFTLRTGVLKTYIRAAFVKQKKPSLIVNTPETSSTKDQQDYPVIVKHIAVSQSDDFIRNFQLLIDNPSVGDSKEFRANIQLLINNPKNKKALNYFGIKNTKNSPQYLTHLQGLMKNKNIANSPDFMHYLKRLINNPTDSDALHFFEIDIVKKAKKIESYLEKDKKIAVRFISNRKGGAALIQLIESEKDISVFSRKDSKGISLIRDGKLYIFNKSDTGLVAKIARDIKNKIKPTSKFIDKPEDFSGVSYNQLIKNSSI